MNNIEQFKNKILLGDCLEILKDIPDNSIDAIITDPPYSSGGRSLKDKIAPPSQKYEQTNNKFVHRPNFAGDVKDTRAWLCWCNLWISECHRILKDGGYFLMFSDWRQLPTASDALQIGDIIWRGVVVWNKGLGSRAPHKGYFRHQCEYILWGTKGKCKKAVHAGPYPGCFTYPVLQKDKFHIAGKPTALMEQLVQIVPENSLILDPFAGSGTTALAAKLNNRNYISIEKEETYHKIALDRLNF